MSILIKIEPETIKFALKIFIYGGGLAVFESFAGLLGG